MKKLILLVFTVVTNICLGQKVEDLFTPSDTKIQWLGVDFSKVQLVGDFAQFADAGQKSVVEIKNKYFPGWNGVIVHERDKYDIEGMLRKENIVYNIDMITDLNSKTATENMEPEIAVKFSAQDIKDHVKQYTPDDKDGIGIVLIAETLNKFRTEAWFHFVAIDLTNNDVLFADRLQGTPGGIGLRNYWAGAIYDIIKQIKNSKYKEWKSRYTRK